MHEVARKRGLSNLLNKLKATEEDGYFEEMLEKNENFETLKRAELVLELANIFSCRFDSDRHPGNILHKETKLVHIDFKGISSEQWSEKGYNQLAEILLAVVGSEDLSAINFQDKVYEAQNEIRERGEQLDPLVLEVQKAISAIAGYATDLEPQELYSILLAALSDNPDPELVKAIQEQAPDHIRPFIDQFTSGQLDSVIAAMGLPQFEIIRN